MTEMQELAERLRAEAIERAKEPDWFDEQLSKDIATAAEAILTLERERDEARAELDRLFVENDALIEANKKNWAREGGLEIALGQCRFREDAAEARATAAEAQVQALREALEPFAKAADDGEGMLRDGGYPFPADDAPAGYEQRHGGYVQMTPLWGHLRRARAALRSEP